MDGQMSIFDFLDEPQPGDYVERHGRYLRFDECKIGMLVVMDMSTESHEWYQVGRVEGIADPVDRDGRKLSIHTTGNHHMIISEHNYHHAGDKIYAVRKGG